MRFKTGFICHLVLLISTASCAQETHKIFLPEEEVKSTPLNYATAIQAIILSSDKIYCYPGENLDSGHVYSLLNTNSFRKFLQTQKKQFGDSLLVILKPAINAGYNSTVDVLDEMSINEIQKYVLLELTSEEKKKFSIVNADKVSSSITAPTPGTSSKEVFRDPDNTHVVLTFKFDTSNVVSYTIKSTKGLSTAEVAMNETKLQSIIAKAQHISSQQKKLLTVILKGNGGTNYNHFKPLMDALRGKNIHKFQMSPTQ